MKNNAENTSKAIEVKLNFNDITGQSKFVIITFTELEIAFKEGIKVDCSDIIGLTGICENEFVLWPVSASERFVQVNEKIVQLIYDCNVTTSEGIDVKEIENELLQSVLNEAQNLGFNNKGENQLIHILFPKTKATILHFAS